VSTSNARTVASSRGPTWIVSAWWDLTYVVVTPLLIVPAVLLLARRALTPEQVSLGVIAFASLGHHLPGFMRAYGDRDLFRRYRLRFLLAPPLVFAVALLFSPPTSLATTFGLPWKHLHGLELILLIWGTWHGLMQTYGFMRIYDVRLGVDDRRSARLDHGLCLIVFVAGVVFSDARVFGIANGMGQSGLPLFGPDSLRVIRLVVGGVGIAVLAAYLANLALRRSRGEPVSWIKLLLLGITGWFYWYTGRLSTNVLIGLAMFEIYHAVQYDAVVWIYNRRLFGRAGERFGPLRFLFGDRWSMLGVYLAAIAAYGAIRYFTVDANAYVFRGGSEDLHRWLVALFVTSATLHFYFDGFIWKVSEKKIQQNLVDDRSSSGSRDRRVPTWIHAAKWTILATLVAILLVAERRQPGDHDQREANRLRALVALTPDLPECQTHLSRDALQHGDVTAAIEHARRALDLRPRSHAVWADLGIALMQSGEFDEALHCLVQAATIAPDYYVHQSNLGLVLAQLGKTDQAEKHFRRAVEMKPQLETPREHLIEFYLSQGQHAKAAAELAELARRFPGSLTVQLARVSLLRQQGDHEAAARLAASLANKHPKNWRAQLAYGATLNASGAGNLALGPLTTARQLRPHSAEVYYQLGLAHFQSDDAIGAIDLLTRATQLDPSNFEAHFQLANTFYVLGRTSDALAAYARCAELRPHDAQLATNYGGLLATLGRPDEAEQLYRDGLAANPQSGQLCYNLGILLWQQTRRTEARELIGHAERLGVTIPSDVRDAISP